MALSGLQASLAELCTTNPLAQKWFVVPTATIGRQVVDSLALSHIPTFNVRVFSMDMLARHLATNGTDKLDTISEVEKDSLIQNLYAKAAAEDGYLSSLALTDGLRSRMSQMIEDLRMAGLGHNAIDPNRFELPEKGREVRALLQGYEEGLADRELLDRAAVYKLAIRKTPMEPIWSKKSVAVCCPASMAEALRGLQKQLWEAIPEECRHLLGENTPKTVAHVDEVIDARLLCHMAAPLKAPEAKGDDSASIFSAIGELNEVREALRRAMSVGKWDEGEIVVSDAETYNPLIYETLLAWTSETDKVPVTFFGGTSARHTGPVRALEGLLSWMQNGYYQKEFNLLLLSGTIKLDFGDLDSGVAIGTLYAKQVLADVPIGKGADAYLPALTRAIGKCREEAKKVLSDPQKRYNRIRARVLTVFSEFFQWILPPADGPVPAELAARLIAILNNHVRIASAADGAASASLLRRMEDLKCELDTASTRQSDLFADLLALVRTTVLHRAGPKPGCLYVSTLRNGGHSGRKHMFLVGMDSSRFPGAGLQDPLLLDHERVAISAELQTAAGHLQKKNSDMVRLVSRLRGSVTLSFCRAGLGDDRQLFPSWPVEAAFRILSNNRTGDQEALFKWMDPPVAFAPADTGAQSDTMDWLLWTMCGAQPVENSPEFLLEGYPHVKQGYVAHMARQEAEFTEYDGYVPEAGADHSPYKDDAKPVSPSRMEKYGANPMDYFMGHILELEEPPEFDSDETVWLDAMSKGSLLHTVFELFMKELQDKGVTPRQDRDLPRLRQILRDQIVWYRKEVPVPSKRVYLSEVAWLEKAIEIFLRQEEQHCKDAEPAFFELAFGISGVDVAALGSKEALPLKLATGKRILLRGLIDRVDKVGANGYRVWDYKTGGTYKYSNAQTAFEQGRLLQHGFYMAMLQSRLDEVEPGSKVLSAGYFFPSIKGQGERIKWDAEDLKTFPGIIALICDGIAAGLFPVSNESGDVFFSDFVTAFNFAGGKEHEWMAVKLAEPANTMLEPLRKLRQAELMKEEASDE